MCGLVGVNVKNRAGEDAGRIFSALLSASATRGRDSSGAVFIRDGDILLCKEAVGAHQLSKKKGFLAELSMQCKHERFVAFGHSRMATHGSAERPENNHPIVSQGVAVLHNGIIVNAAELWRTYPHYRPITNVDSEILCVLIREAMRSFGPDQLDRFKDTLLKLLAKVEGSYTFFAVEPSLSGALYATNTGSLYSATLDESAAPDLILASEERVLRNVIPRYAPAFNSYLIKQVPLHSVEFLRYRPAESPSFCHPPRVLYQGPTTIQKNSTIKTPQSVNRLYVDLEYGFQQARAYRESLVHCTRCILPATMPFIAFNESGICNYCTNYEERTIQGLDTLERKLNSAARSDVRYIVPFSGGRDSAYALHFLKKELGRNVVAFTYDWGVLTDLGRRNQARMLGALGIEQILVSADIQQKRSNVKINLVAWLRDPHPGMIPLLMAGDKHYFYHLNRLRKDLGGIPTIYSDNSLEKSDFKYGFAGVHSKFVETKSYNIGFLNIWRLLYFYLRQFAHNSGYWNNSVLDTATAYWSSFFEPKDFIHLFKYVRWDEKVVVDTLVEKYGWETAQDTSSTWRIGDGTAAFYNYAYFVLAGLTEHDTFRSNQIREGLIAREEAMALSLAEAAPRPESILWYCNVIGVDAEQAIRILNNHSFSRDRKSP